MIESGNPMILLIVVQTLILSAIKESIVSCEFSVEERVVSDETADPG